MDLTKVETLINLDQPILDIFGRKKITRFVGAGLQAEFLD